MAAHTGSKLAQLVCTSLFTLITPPGPASLQPCVSAPHLLFALLDPLPRLCHCSSLSQSELRELRHPDPGLSSAPRLAHSPATLESQALPWGCSRTLLAFPVGPCPLDFLLIGMCAELVLNNLILQSKSLAEDQTEEAAGNPAPV